METNLIIENRTANTGLKKTKTAQDNKGSKKMHREATQPLTLKESDYQYFMSWKKAQDNKRSKQQVLFFNIGLSIALGLVVMAFEWEFVENPIVVDLQMTKVAFEEFIDVPQTEQPPPAPPKVIQQPVIVEVPDEEILQEVEVHIDVETTQDMVVELVTYEEEAIPEEVAEEIFLIVEDAPTPTGGIAAFYKYVGESIVYPSKALREHISGRVFVQFVVSTTGEIENVKVVKGIGHGCDEEAIRIIENSPTWQPGKQRGKAVKVQMVIPITFKMAS